MPDRLLIVEDEKSVREVLLEFMKKGGYAVEGVSSGQEALEVISKQEFDAVLLDIKLRDISGLEVLKRIKEIKPGLIVVMITGFGMDDDLVARAKELGSAGYIGKNLPVAEILRNFRSFVEAAKKI